MVKLKPRLSMAASMVRAGSRLCDVGTDHAYLPVSLLLDGRIKSAIASDLRTGPLENAKSTVTSCAVSDRVELRLSDGLQRVSCDEADDIVIAGMGGILISEIIMSAPSLKKENIKFILQPQTHDEVLRRSLFENGFEITEEKACFEDGKVYICMSAFFTGKIREHSETEIMLGGYTDYDDEASKAFVQKKMKRIHTRINALEKMNVQNDELAVLKEIVGSAEK